MKMTEEELNTLAKIEKAIIEKYGRSALYNPSEDWTPEKEKAYLEDLKKLSVKERENINDVLEKYEILAHVEKHLEHFPKSWIF